MHSQTLTIILVWVAVLCSTRVVSGYMSKLQKTEVTHKLNMLMQHSGWQFMDVKILIKKPNEIVDPVSLMLQLVSLHQKPINESNVQERHREICTVLMCKYGEIVFNYKALVNHYIRVCENEKSALNSFQKYYDCFNLLLVKLHSISPRLKCMMDALVLMYSLVPKWKSKHSVMVAIEKLADYTSILGPALSTKLTEYGTTVDVVDLEMSLISKHISDIYNKNVFRFNNRRCIIRADRKWTAHTHTLIETFVNEKSKGMTPQETTVLQYVVDEMDIYSNEIMSKWFYDLGFAYGVQDKITIRSI